MVGKTVNFATLYGQGPHALSEQLGVDFNTAKTYIEEYFAQFPKVKAWKAHVLAEAEKTGYVETIWGRRRYIPELKSTNRMFKAAGERAAINHPIQGTNADMIKKAMVNIDKEISSNKTLSENCQLILTVHDELMFDCSPDQLKKVAAIVKEQMESVLELSVPVIVELKSGPSWGEMEKLTI
jgi:DNA polymerase-1